MKQTCQRETRNTDRITLTAQEVANMLGISKRFLYELAQIGELPCRRFGKKVLFSRQAIHNLISEGGMTNEGRT